MRFRRARGADRPALVRLVNEAFRVEDDFVDGDRTNEGDVRDRMSQGVFLVAEDDRGLAGAVYVRSASEPGSFGLLAVHPSRQGRGLGRRLVALAEAYLRDAGRRQVEISAVSQRLELLPFYKRLGYSQDGSSPLPESVKLKKPCSLLHLRRDLPLDEVRFSRDDRNGFEIDTSVFLRRPVPTVFSFFADALNLGAVTPPWLRFEVLSRAPVAMYTGARISCRARLHGLRVRWNGEITTWDPPHTIVDEQRRGPYDYWRHEHEFLDTDEGTLVLERVRYDMPMRGLAQALFVRRDLERIFRYRQARLRVLLG